MQAPKYPWVVVLVLVVLLVPVSVLADSVTANPDTSPAWPVGTFFEPGEVGQTTDPLGPFSGTPIQFRGYTQGGSQIGLNPGPCGFLPPAPYNPCLVFSYSLTFSNPTAISSITFTGDAFNGAFFALLDSSNSVLDSLSVNSGNVGHTVTYTLLTPGATGTSFNLDLYDGSTYWTYVTDISVASAPVAPVPEPSTVLLLGTGLLPFGGALRRKWLSYRSAA